MNKYTTKIKTFLDLHLDSKQINKSIINYNQNQIIKKFIEIFRNQYVTNNIAPINLIKSEKIKKMHEYEDNSLLHIILANTFENDSNFSNKEFFYNWIRENASKIKITNEKFSEYHNILFNPTENRKELHKIMYEGIFVSADILHHSESEDLNYKIYSNSNTELHIYYPDSNVGPDIQIILRIIDFYRSLTNKVDMYVKIVVFYGEQKKYFPKLKNQSICSDNVNSGATTTTATSSELIQIWRKEEFYKVLIHELIHYFKIDFYIQNSIYKVLNNHFQNFITIKGIDRINESYTETLATVIHCCFYAVYNNMNFSDVFSYELLFSYLQVAKILNHFECKKYDDLLSTKFIQTTSAFSYYIIKCMFMEHLQIMLDFWTTNDFTILKSNTVQSNYVELYKNIVKFESLNKKLINKIIDIIHEHPICFAIKTMRMTMFQV